MAHQFIRVPPDGAGKRIHSHVFQEDGIDYYQQFVGISDIDNPDYSIKVDNRGQAYFRFAEGAQHFDGFGNSKISQQITIKDYHAYYTDLSEEMYDDVVGVDSSIEKVAGGAVLFTVGTNPGDQVIRTTDRNFHLVMGNSRLVGMNTSLTDSGKINLYRAWGMYDDNDGLFFYLNGTELGVAVRSSSSGSPVDYLIPRSEWNEDKLDGTGPSGMIINLVKGNAYWIDFQNSLGRLRWGVFDNEGQRIVAHSRTMISATTGTNFTTSTLPLRWEMKNLGTVVSISQFKAGSAYVAAEGKDYLPATHVVAGVPPVAIPITSTESVVWAMRLKEFFKGKQNRGVVIPKFISAYVTDSPVVFTIRRNPSALTFGEAPYDGWVMDLGSNSIVEGAPVVAAFEGGDIVATFMTCPGRCENLSLSNFFSYLSECLYRKANGTSNVYILTARTLGVNATAEVFAPMSWEEIL